MPLVSVAMTTYNGERYLREQLDSIFRQTVQDFELVIRDDCSSDGTWQIVQDYAGRFPCIRAVRNERNVGFRQNFADALSLCTGDFVAFADQDDVWTQTHLEDLLSCIGENYLACGNVDLIDDTGKTLKNMRINVNRFISENYPSQFLQLLHINFVQGCTCLFKKELISRIIPIPQNQKYHDNWIGLVAASYMKPIVYLNKILLHYRQHGKNVTSQGKYSVFEKIEEKLKWNDDVVPYLSQDEQLNIHASVHDYLFRFVHKIFSVKDVLYFFRNYKLIYQTESLRLLPFRFVKRFILWR